MNAIDTLKQLCEARAKATIGDWGLGTYTSAVLFGPNSDGTGIEFDNQYDPPFIALAANTDFPAILVEMESQQAELVRLREIVADAQTRFHELACTNGMTFRQLQDHAYAMYQDMLQGRLPRPVARAAAEAAAKEVK